MRKRSCMIIFITVLTALLFCAAPALAADYQALPGQEVRVLLSGSSSATSYTIAINSGTYDIVAANDISNSFGRVTAGTNITFSVSGGTYSFTAGDIAGSAQGALMAVPSDSNDSFIFNNKAYRGCFKAIHSGSYYYAVNQINVELYLYGVVGRELGYGYSDAATQAQAVAARSYALANYSASNRYYDLTATTSSQVYGGKSAETNKIISAVDNTRGQVLQYNGRTIQTYYSSNMGGYTENIENVWMSDAVPIKGVPSPHDALAGNYSSYGASTYSWTVEYTPAQLVSRANSYSGKNIGTYTGITYSDTLDGVTSVSGRAMTLTIHGTNGSVTATKDNIRSLLNLKSTLINIIDTSSGADQVYVMGADGRAIQLNSLDGLYAVGAGGGVIETDADGEGLYAANDDETMQLGQGNSGNGNIIIQGRGYGHGVGLSQFGAIAMGDDGYSWQEIIEHYFCTDTGIKLVKIY